jgi:hypothetical protein
MTIEARTLAEVLGEVHRRNVSPWRDVRLTNAHVVGDLLLGDFHTHLALMLISCRFDGAIGVERLRARSLVLHGSRYPGLRGAGIELDGDLDMSRSCIAGRVDLRSARIGGSVLLDDAQIISAGFDRAALWADHLEVREHLDARRLRISGGTRLINAHAGTRINFEGARIALHTPTEPLVHPLRSNDGTSAGLELALTLAGATAESVWLNFEDRPPGKVRLAGMQVRTLYDHPDSWPRAIDLTGFSYQQLIGRRPKPNPEPENDTRQRQVPEDPRGFEHDVPIEQRLAWLRRNAPFSPEPYERLASFYRLVGREADARRVLLHKERRQRSHKAAWRRPGGHLLDALVGYGYQNWKAVLWLLALWGAGTITFLLHPPTPLHADAAPNGNAVFQALDLLLPVVDLGQDGAWRYTGIASYVSTFLILSGWTLTTAVIAGLSRLLNPRLLDLGGERCALDAMKELRVGPRSW